MIRCVLASLSFALIALPAFGQAPAAQTINIVLTGDTNLHRKLSIYDDKPFLEMIGHIRGADVAFTNFEQAIHNFEFAGAATITGPNSQSPLWAPDEVKWAGFKMVGIANNHTYDYGVDGLRSTIKALDDAGIAHAGAGENLAFARAPTYVDTKNGRVALIATTSSAIPESIAGEQRPDIKGRPGLNPLRYKTTYVVDQTTADTLKQLKNLDARLRGAYSAFESGVTFGGAEIVVGDKLDVLTAPNDFDLKQIVAEVQEAKLNADVVIVSIHAHERGHGDVEKPPNFVVEFAHAAIDAGADVFVGHGPLILKGIEIYKGKPIFYSLGNFVNNKLGASPFLSAEAYQAQGIPQDALAGQWGAAHEGSGLSYTDSVGDAYWESVVANVTFTPDHKLQAIKLYPIALGEPGTRHGTPRPASPATAAAIFDHLNTLSSPMGTKIDFTGGVGVVEMDGAAKH